MIKIARNTLSDLLWSSLFDLMNEELGRITPSKTDLDKAVFLAEAMRAVKSGKKRLIIDIDTSNDGYGRG